MEFSRQAYWSAFPVPSPGDLPNPGIKPRYPALQVEALPSELLHLLLTWVIPIYFILSCGLRRLPSPYACLRLRQHSVPSSVTLYGKRLCLYPLADHECLEAKVLAKWSIKKYL